MYKGKAKELLGKINVGDRIKIRKAGYIYEGILMPRTELGDDRHIVLKLDNGYNIGIEIDGVSIEKVASKKCEVTQKRPLSKKPAGKKKIVLLGTGGTIASKIDYTTGAVHPSFSTEELVNAIPELLDLADISSRVLFNILSENMGPKYWRMIAREVAEELNSGASGVVIAHGTDTLHYTSAALSFMLKNLCKPVVLVGSQRSSDRPSSDSSMNLISAVKVACSDIGEVVVVMHGSTNDDCCLIHRGTKVRKMHTSRRDAFKSINSLPLGRVNDKIETFQKYNKRRDCKVEIDDRLNENVALLKIYPGISREVLDYHIDKYDGIVLEGTGLGHIPEALFKSVENAKEKGKPVVMTSQTLYGRVDMKVYSTGRELLNRGVISGEDILPEVAYVKLMHVLGITNDYEEVRRLMQTNLAGEISERTSLIE
jgi:glutamyl-tRNA(Gln) amidotransferase subunit D